MEQLFSWRWVESQVAQTIREWDQCAQDSAPSGPGYSLQEQLKREAAYDQGLQAVELEAKRVPRSRAARLEAQERIVAIFPRFASVALGLDDGAVELLTEGFLPVGTQLARWASRFDPTLSMAGTIQACRNAWTACGLQPLLGDRMRITPSILGYSLLYPYSDNFMDHERVTTAEKLRFSARFRDRLCGLEIPSRNRHESSVWAMVRLIEGQFPRACYPQVYECLLAIHRGQENSIAQLKGCRSIPDHRLLEISCAKGGTSVLADACLSHGWLDEEQSRFAFDWGVLLQLGDDLQDVREDLQRGSETLFSRSASERIPLDGLVFKLLHFSDQAAAHMGHLPNGDPVLKSLLKMSWRSLIHMAVANSPEFFTPSFLAELEAFSPFRFGFLRARRKRHMGRRGLYKVLFDAFLEAGDGENPVLPNPESWTENSISPEAASYVSSSRNIGWGMSLR